jgi:hypothetical protein
MKKMKKYIIASVLALSTLFVAQAQGSKSTIYPTALELNQAKATWFNSNNAAGMILTPLSDFGTLSVGYDWKVGDYKLQQEGNLKTLDINTSGSRPLGKARVWGEFSYQNITQEDTKFNTLRLTLDPDMPYILADSRLSYFKKQTYNMTMKAATPVLWDLVAFGATANYYTKSGAKQIDPRCESFEYGIEVKPSAVFTFGDHSAGLTFMYKNAFDRYSPLNSNNQQDQPAFNLRGVGTFVDVVVGSFGGLGTYYYKTNRLGGALQYGYQGLNAKVLAEGYYTYQVIDVFHSPSKPRRMGSTIQHVAGGNLQTVLEGDSFTNKITLDGYMRSTDGIEYIQMIDATYEVQQWVTIAKFIRSKYDFTGLSLKYDLYKDSGAGYDWMAGIQGQYTDRLDTYILPESSFKAENVYGEIYGKKNFMVGNNSIVVGLSAGYNYNMAGEHIYNGPFPDSEVIRELYEKDLAILSANYYQFGVNLKAIFPMGEKSTIYVAASCKYLRSDEELHNYSYGTDTEGKNFWWNLNPGPQLTPSIRTFANFSIGFTF